MIKNLDLVELFIFLFASELEQDTTKLNNLIKKIDVFVVNEKFAKVNFKAEYVEHSMKHSKIKKFFEKQFPLELKNYQNSRRCSILTDEIEIKRQLKFSFLWSLICVLKDDSEEKCELFLKFKVFLNDENYEILEDYKSILPFFEDMHLIYKKCFESDLDLETDRLQKEVTIIREIAKGGFGKVYEIKSKKDHKTYALKRVKIKSKILNYTTNHKRNVFSIEVNRISYQ
jgi:hypothetical protein